MRWIFAVTALVAACAPSSTANRDGGGDPAGSEGDAGAALADLAVTASGDLASADGALPPGTLDGNRDRLLATYLIYLHAHPGAQSNGLDGAALANVCDLWSALAPSGRVVFLTLSARLGGSTLGSDGSPALAHVVRLYRVVGGGNATASDPGSCGGGEYNRMILSIDTALHDALVAAHDHQGAAGTSGARDLADVAAGATRFWRDSHDAAGPHAPFDLSDETEDGAPRGQVQYFRDPTSPAALAPLGRMDLSTLVDPSALEIDQDYDCVHNSNPSCSYTLYGPLCAPAATKSGLDIYESNYGLVESGWHPSGC